MSSGTRWSYMFNSSPPITNQSHHVQPLTTPPTTTERYHFWVSLAACHAFNLKLLMQPSPRMPITHQDDMIWFLGNRESLWINLDLPLSLGWGNRIQRIFPTKLTTELTLASPKTWGKVGKFLLLFQIWYAPKHSNIGSLDQECRCNTTKIMSHQKTISLAPVKISISNPTPRAKDKNWVFPGTSIIHNCWSAAKICCALVIINVDPTLQPPGGFCRQNWLARTPRSCHACCQEKEQPIRRLQRVGLVGGWTDHRFFRFWGD